MTARSREADACMGLRVITLLTRSHPSTALYSVALKYVLWQCTLVLSYLVLSQCCMSVHHVAPDWPITDFLSAFPFSSDWRFSSRPGSSVSIKENPPEIQPFCRIRAFWTRTECPILYAYRWNHETSRQAYVETEMGSVWSSLVTFTR